MKIYKKITTTLLCLLCLVSLAACSSGTEAEKIDPQTTASQTKTQTAGDDLVSKSYGQMSISYPAGIKIHEVSDDNFFILFDEKGDNGFECKAKMDEAGKVSQAFEKVTAQEFAEGMLEKNPDYKEILNAEYIEISGEKALNVEILGAVEGVDTNIKMHVLTYEGHDYYTTAAIQQAKLGEYQELREQIFATVRIEN